MKLSFLHHQVLFTDHKQPHTFEGSEFLNDLIRMVEQPLSYKEKKRSSRDTVKVSYSAREMFNNK